MSAATAAAAAWASVAALSDSGRVEQRLEQFDERARGACVVVDDRLDVRLAVGKTGLPQVLCVAAQHRDLLPGQPGPQHQLVEPVDLDAAVPDRGDRVGEPGGGGVAFGRVLASGIDWCGEILNW